MRPKLRYALAALATVTTIVALAPQAAFADSSPIVLDVVQNSGSDIAKMEVGLTAPTAITSISATLKTLDTGMPVATVTAFTLVFGTAEDGYWDTVSPLKLPALGAYVVDLTVVDAGGDTLTQDGPWEFDYLATTSFKNVTVDRKSVDITHQQVTISGQLIGDPPNGPAAPLAGATVYIADNGAENVQLVTDANGDFAGTDTIVASESIGMIYPSDVQNYTYSQSKTFPITLKQSKTRLLLDLSSKRIQVGQSVSVSGSLQWDSPTGWLPLTNETVSTNTCMGDYQTATTDDNGAFVLPRLSPAGATCDVAVGWQSDDPYEANAVGKATIVVVQPVDFQSFTATRKDATTVTASGELEFPGLIGAGYPTVSIQTSANGRGGWTTVATNVPTNWDGVGNGFSVDVLSTTAGFWRATFTGNQQLDSATSTVASVPAP